MKSVRICKLLPISSLVTPALCNIRPPVSGSLSSKWTSLSFAFTTSNFSTGGTRDDALGSDVSSSSWKLPEGADTKIVVYNTQTKRKEPFILPRKTLVRWYVCGPTVYDKPHVGHACTYVRTDSIRRVLTNYFNLDVAYVMGITDVDDKIINRAKEENVEPSTVARFYEDSFFSTMHTLNVLPPSSLVRVTQHTDEIISFIQDLLAKGMAYSVQSGSVYFDSVAYGDNYCLRQPNPAGRTTKPPPEDGKRCLTDFALWKAVKEGEPFWEAPWGKGRPGWHIECSAMASKIFGGEIDIHSGGNDLIFPHHEAEIHQSCAYHSCSQWVNYWLHTGPVHSEGAETKMSKSLNNYVLIEDMLKMCDPAHFRLYCLMSQYRSAMEFSADRLVYPGVVLQRVQSFLSASQAYLAGSHTCDPLDDLKLEGALRNTRLRVAETLADDFDFRGAIDVLLSLVNFTHYELDKKMYKEPPGPIPPQRLQQLGQGGSLIGITEYVKRMFSIFGVELGVKVTDTSSGSRLTSVVDLTVRFRETVRKFALALDVEDKQERKSVQQERKQLLQSADSLREDLKTFCQIQIKDTHKVGDVLQWESLVKKSSSKEEPTQDSSQSDAKTTSS